MLIRSTVSVFSYVTKPFVGDVATGKHSTKIHANTLNVLIFLNTNKKLYLPERPMLVISMFVSTTVPALYKNRITFKRMVILAQNARS